MVLDSFLVGIGQQTVHYFERHGDAIASSILRFFASVFFAAIILFIGFHITDVISKWCKRTFDRLDIESEVKTFLLSFIKIGLKALVIIWAVTIIGVPNSSIITLFGTASVSIGLALQGGLSNVTGGLIILLIKPFRIGDYIMFNSSSMNCEGTVEEIDIFYTKIASIDNKTIIVPNGVISNATLVNVTKQHMRRMNLTIGVSYDANITYVKETIEHIIANEAAVIKDTEHEVDIFVDNLSSSSVDFGIRFWVLTDDYWPVRWRMLETIKTTFEEKNIAIPYNQLDVFLKKQ